MRILVDQKQLMTSPISPVDLQITQVDKTPEPNDGTAINGRFLIPTVEGIDFHVDNQSYVWPVDGQDVNSQSFAYLLASFPMFGHIYFNPLLTAMDVEEIDFAMTFRDVNLPPPWGPVPPQSPVYHRVRVQTGREISADPATLRGNYPVHTAILPCNYNLVTMAPSSPPPRPGMLITKEIDLEPYTGSAGTDEFMLYWRLYSFAVSDDIASDFGATAGRNEPAIRRIAETDQEPADFSAYISPDNGLHWCQIGRMEPLAFTIKTTKIRIAFMNMDTANKRYFANYAVMF